MPSCCLSLVKSRAFLLSAAVIVPMTLLAGVALQVEQEPGRSCAGAPCDAAEDVSCSRFHATDMPRASVCPDGDGSAGTRGGRSADECARPTAAPAAP